MSNRGPRADYGLDAPHVVRNLLLAGAVLAGLAMAADRLGDWGRFRPMLFSMAAGFLAGGLLMTASSRFGKLGARDRLLDRLALQGHEAVLDVGCGHGLLLIGAARRLPHGRAVGVDLWSVVDQAANSAAATLENGRREGVAGRVEVRDGDMRALPFPDASFDAVVSSLAIHNVATAEGRRTAIGEIARVLRPGGRIAIMDIAHIGEYAAALRAAGMSDVRTTWPSPWVFPPTRAVTARR